MPKAVIIFIPTEAEIARLRGRVRAAEERLLVHGGSVQDRERNWQRWEEHRAAFHLAVGRAREVKAAHPERLGLDRVVVEFAALVEYADHVRETVPSIYVDYWDTTEAKRLLKLLRNGS